MLSYGYSKGIASSKIFDYINLNKKIILYPSDNDVLDEIVSTTQLGVVANTIYDLENAIEKIIIEKLQNGHISVNPNRDFINVFSRENQASILFQHISKIIYK